MKKLLNQILRNESGWTFVETLIVIGIVIILTGSVGFMGMKYLEKAKIVSTRSEMQAISLAIDSYYLDGGIYPTEDQGLKVLWEKPVLEPVPKEWSGPYVSKNDFNDAWGNPYEYSMPGKGGLPYTMTSLGSDNYPGGEGNAKDINSWED